MTVSQLVKLPNVIDPDTVEGYKKCECIPTGKITKMVEPDTVKGCSE